MEMSEKIIYMSLGALLIVVVVLIIVFLYSYIRHSIKSYIGRVVADKCNAPLDAMRRREREIFNEIHDFRQLKHQVADILRDAKTNTHQTDENMLAKNNNLPQNDSQPDAAASDREPPFWRNRKKLEVALDAIKQDDVETLDHLPQIASMMPLERWQTLDDKAFHLGLSDDEAHRPENSETS